MPQWQDEITGALRRARERLAQARVEGVDWYWRNEEKPRRALAPDTVRLLAPFDPVVHDRTRFELMWGWANLAVKNGTLTTDLGYAAGQPPPDRAFKHELDAELERMRLFLGAQV